MSCPPSELDRLAALRRYAILDTAPEGPFDDLARLAALICRTPIALVSLVDADRQWFKSCIGLDVRETPRQFAFCDHTIRQPEILVVPDATAERRFAANPLVTGPPGIRFYAGAPLVTPDGFALGTICAIDLVPRELDANQREALEGLARLVVGQLELRRKADELERADLASRRLAAIVESSDDAIIAKDLDGIITSWNAAAERIFGYAAGEILGRPITVLIPEGSADEEAMILGRIRQGERVDHFETRRRAKDGRLLDLSITVSPIRDATGTIVGASKIARDVTERKRIERDLRLLQAAVENANDAILITEAEPIDQPGPRVVYVNPAFTRTTGFAAGDIIGKTPRILQGPGTDRSSLDALRSRLRAWRPVRAELLNYRKDGTEFWVELDIRPVADEAGWFTHWVSVQRDITARKRAERQRRELSEIQVRDLNAQLEQRVRRLDSLRQVDQAIVGGHDMGRALEVIVAQARDQLRVDAASVLIADPGGRGLTFAAGSGFLTEGIASTRLRVGEGHPGLAMLGRRIIAVPELDGAGAAPRAGLSGEGFRSSYAAPLVAKGQTLGVLEVFHRGPIRADGDWTAFLEALAGQAAIAIDNATLFRDLQRSNSELVAAYDATIEGWARALDLRDKETEGHTRRVTGMAVRLARAMGLRGGELLAVRRGAMLHDIGKMGIPDAILLKPGPLTDEERSVMMRHPAYAHEWLSPIPFLREALEIPYAHHEKLDGSGYPRGLQGDEIPLAARIFAAVDIWDALSSDRPYRRGWPQGRVRDHLRSLAGSHLDPGVVDTFLRVLESPQSFAPPSGDEPGWISDARLGGPEGWAPRRPNRARKLLLRCRDLRAENRTLAELATTDELTGLGNRRRLHEGLEAARSSGARRGWPISVILMDVDHFKSFNDAHGHSAGDGALRSLARLLRSNSRPHDIVARYGGEEFAIIAEDVDVEASRVYAERLRACIEAHPWAILAMTASFGIATGSASEGVGLIEAADRALYRSKREGRNCVTHDASPVRNEMAMAIGVEKVGDPRSA